MSDRPSHVEKGSPWKHYQAQFELNDLGGTLIVASRHRKLFHISELARTESKQILENLKMLRHPNIVEFIEAYMTSTSFHAVFEATAISLLHVAKCPIYPDEAQLGAIVGQVVDGLSYLEGEGLEHTSIDGGNVLMTDAGVVKIGN
ncbi:hypothetical protein HER10_EVM0007608 [Colletotrichum scovillei]|uniref:uncharacterized protein n=1 Tax=Colletotrichum scovillei TaxID=1209932 RepID=UPI0015C3EBB0|nr:uncharacterized protein HER10_EVM0007608 [Colletotrichum scovillei]KAF4772732.1 hypothetical protein HER10_EVM0007608 [Colletotrichum scovillei]